MLPPGEPTSSWPGPAPIGPAQAPAIALPVESRRSAGNAFALLAFLIGGESVPEPSPLSPVHVMSAYAVQLSRYTAERLIPITIGQIGAGETKGPREYVAQVTGSTTGEELLAGAARALTGPSGIVPQHEGHRATFSWLDDPAVLGNPAALEAIAREGNADLHLLAASGPGGELHAAFAWREGEFSSQTVEGFASHLTTVVRALAREPGRPLDELPLLAEGELQWLDEVARGPVTASPAPLAHEAFEEQADLRPAAIAARYHDGSLTYQELNQRANRLAHLLSHVGVQGGERVVVCLEPGTEVLVALLGVLKAGGAYVPVDPTYPRLRIEAMLEEAGAAAIVSRRALLERLALQAPAVIDLDAHPQASFPSRNPGVAGDREAPATVYFTSGTTGRPKGVVASRANLGAYVDSARRHYRIGPGDVVPVIARLSFSISMFELMMPLASGATVLMLDRQQVLDMDRLTSVLAEATVFHCGPSLLRKVLGHVRDAGVEPSRFRKVRHASTGGDMVPAEVLAGMQATFPKADVFVIYGCSEVSCMGCTHFYSRGAPIERVFVGRPFENTIVRVLDSDGRPVPPGIRGEVYFAGAGVTLGYLGQPALTAERFTLRDGVRYYRTGDVGRLHRNGAIELLGRDDFQVKLRGMRIELAEVEHHLLRAPGVREAVAASRVGADGEPTLAAWVVLAPSSLDERTRLAEIRRHMAANLPDYMVPSNYAAIESMPLNHNLKLDRRALLHPVSQRDPAAQHRPPLTALERAMAAEWQEALGTGPPSLDDNFFEMGGDSLRAVEFIRRMEAGHGIVVDGMDVLRETLEVLARTGDRLAAVDRDLTLTPAPGYALETFYFGPDGSLYGALHGPARPARLAVLLVPPVAQERVRSHFVLRRLSRELADQGVASLHFDFFGSGDSAGRHVEATCRRWEEDIAAALGELAARTRASRLVAVGVRLGATLLDRVLERGTQVARAVYWDPVMNGQEWYSQMQRAHRRYVRGMQYLRLGRPPRSHPGAGEFLGALWSERAIAELCSLRIGPPAHERRIVLTNACPSDGTDLGGVAIACRWGEAGALDDIIPDNGLARVLAREVLG